jgi:malonate-semialdehyde dehydrogenase (acetylating)/methylmalonate-semialdehyde dehydrogenase
MGVPKNHLVILPDADLERSVETICSAAFGCAGERCMAGSTVIAVGGVEKKLLLALAAAARAIKVGPTDRTDQPDMGPVISAPHRTRVGNLVSLAEQEGARVVCDGRGVKVATAPGGYYLGANIVADVAPDMTIAREEVFGPVLNVMQADDLDGALTLIIEVAALNGYGFSERKEASIVL